MLHTQQQQQQQKGIHVIQSALQLDCYMHFKQIEIESLEHTSKCGTTTWNEVEMNVN